MRLPPHVEGRMGVTDEARNVPQNAIGKYFADKLYGGRNFLNEKFGIPFVDTGLGLGDMFMAEGPEYIEELSWGRPFIEPTGHGFRLDTRLGDILGLPLPYAGGAALLKAGGKASIRGLSKGLNKMNPVDVSRRTFNKGLLGTIATAGLAAKGIPLGLKDIAGAGKPLAIDAIRTAVPAAARAATISVSPAVAKLGNLLLSHGAGDAKHLAKVFKEKGIKGLEKELNEGYIDIKFQNVPDIDPYAVESFVHAGPKAFNRSFKNISSMPKKLMKELKEELNYTFQPDHDLFDSMGFDITASRYMDLGYDPQDLAKILTKSIDIEKLRKTNPKMADEFSKHMNLLLKHPDDYLLDLDDFVGDMAWRQNMTGYRGLDEITEYNVFEFFKE